MTKPRVIMAFTLLAAPAWAQSAHVAPPPAKPYVASTEIDDLIRQAKTAKSAPQPLISKPLMNLGDYRVNFEYRAAKAPGAINDADTELFAVLDGTGNLIAGGTLANASRVDSRTQTGGDVVGGTARYLKKGDQVMVPRGIPFMFVPSPGTPLILTSVRMPG